MIISLSELINMEKTTLPLKFDISKEEMGKLDDWSFKEAAHLDATIKNVHGALVLKGSISALLQGKCSRCLKDVEISIEVDLDCTLVNGLDESQEEDVYIYEDDTLNIQEFIKAYVALELPLQLLCKDDCEGLCHDCGKDLNLGECTCDEDTKPIDPRMEALKKLLK